MINIVCDFCGHATESYLTVQLSLQSFSKNQFCDVGCLYWYLDGHKNISGRIGKAILKREPGTISFRK